MRRPRKCGPCSKTFEAHRGASIVIAGEYQPPPVHAIAHAINHTLGNAGKTVIYTESSRSESGG